MVDREPEYDWMRVYRDGGTTRVSTRRPGSNVVTTSPLEDDVLDLEGLAINECWIDDLDRYEIRMDEETRIDELYEQAGESKELTSREQDLFDRIYDRPLFPAGDRDGCTFRYEDLQQDFVMQHHHPVFMNLVHKDAIRRLDDDFYAIRSDYRSDRRKKDE